MGVGGGGEGAPRGWGGMGLTRKQGAGRVTRKQDPEAGPGSRTRKLAAGVCDPEAGGGRPGSVTRKQGAGVRDPEAGLWPIKKPERPLISRQRAP